MIELNKYCIPQAATIREALKRIINVPARGIGDTTMKKITEEALRQDKSLYQIISQDYFSNLALNAGTTRKIRDFVNMIQDFKSGLNTLNAYELAKQILATRKGTDQNMHPQEFLKRVVNEEFGLKGYCSNVIVLS